MKISTLFGAAVVAVTLMAMPARAAIYLTESFTYTGAVYSANGTFTYNQSNGLLQSIAGDVVTGGVSTAITGLVTGGSPFYPVSGNTNGFNFDNLFDATSQQFTENGILFSFGAGNYGSFYYYPSPFFATWLPDGPTSPADCSVGDLYCPGDTGTLKFAAVSPIPELSSWTMMVLGFLGVGILSRASRTSKARRQRLAAFL